MANQSVLNSQQQSKKYQAAFLTIPGVGTATLKTVNSLLNKTQSSWEEFWVKNGVVCDKQVISKNIADSIKNFKKEQKISSNWESLKQQGIRVVSQQDKAYPPLLKTIDSAPELLFVKGKLKNLFRACQQQLPIAMVGSRKMTSYGQKITQKLTTDLVLNNASIFSGFMYGVDVTAQKQAMAMQGLTVGVLGFGFDYMVPKYQQKLFTHLLEQGAVFISEYAPNTPPSKGTFPRRNRLIAGMSLATVVTEAAKRSGTQITVGFALDYGRDVFAVPGPITNPFSEGTKNMLNQGARLVSSGQEVIKYLSPGNLQLWEKLGGKQTYQFETITKSKKEAEPSAVKKLEAKLSCAKMHSDLKPALIKQIKQQLQTNFELDIDQLATNLDLTVEQLNPVLTMMEISGQVKFNQGQWHLS